MDQFPVGWFFIQSQNGQVLTVANKTMQPSTRVELRPKKTRENHQLWCYYQGHLVNKHSGCVLGTEKQKLKDQPIYQLRRISDDPKQHWQYIHQQLVLADNFALNDLSVPKLVEKQNGCIYELLSADLK